ncbi:Tad domain-containing protein [Pseudarthrobacter sp. H3Y2-7]|uniref:Tad domain-containing protein n=1 Tax=Pseudarthrobacter naphthalenicus TaxID=3031328 RepID=UPI0023AFBB51|nr:Tad domain-containing protein [Pseudarthrobacter sp. H3Y2-7]MDE8667140.1 Tad domain-containing protein [Pseudarthrobacter sp. H3Y2-7]
MAPLAALLMVVLLGFGALAVDVGAMYSEKAQLQNGADSAALAVAQACAKATMTTSPCGSNQKAKATEYANANALDGSSDVVSATVNAGTVNVTTATPAGANGEHFSLYLARALGINSVEIQASAQAVFGGVSAYNSLPMAFSKCEADSTLLKDGDFRFFPAHGSASRDKNEPYPCPGNSSGQEMPGGFGWLVDPLAKCSVYVDTKNPWVDSRPGAAYESPCTDTMLAWWAAKNKTPSEEVKILVPIFDDNDPKRGKHGQFHIQAFAELSIDSWHLSGTSKTNHPPETYLTSAAKDLSTKLGLKNSDLGLFGRFVRAVSLDEAAKLDGSTIYGSTGVKITN